MKYMGSKARIKKHILKIINKNKIVNYVEPFVGGCNLIDKVVAEHKIAGDINPYLISTWQALQAGWIPPKHISREMYNEARDCYNNKTTEFKKYYVGYIGFSGSYGGRFFDGGYAGITMTKTGKSRNYPQEAFNNVMSQLKFIQEVKFYACDYRSLIFNNQSVIYCDPPYYGTKEYAKTGFNSEKFWQWCRDKTTGGHKVYISEYEAPKDFQCIWSKEVSSSLKANGIIKGRKLSTEKLFTL